ncbi:M23 family metallopeptidase, partial [Pseudonocardia terrae]|uniref:M23 family metallopeptidase n=1 Tax=Pseudonocardia terrae TaxID=2905831 RepID=UPI003556073F
SAPVPGAAPRPVPTPEPVPTPGPPMPGPVPGRPSSAELAPGVEYGWPLAPVPAVARPFDEPPFRYGRGHRGADLVGGVGQAVFAARDGVVVFAGPVAGRGVVSVEHTDGLRTTYEPVTGTVAVGVRVARGDPIGVLEAGHAGCPAEACLHWGVRRGVRSTSEYMDPLVLLRPRHVRLLPLPDPWPG